MSPDLWFQERRRISEETWTSGIVTCWRSRPPWATEYMGWVANSDASNNYGEKTWYYCISSVEKAVFRVTALIILLDPLSQEWICVTHKPIRRPFTLRKYTCLFRHKQPSSLLTSHLFIKTVSH